MKHWFSDASAFRRDPLAFVRARMAETSNPLVRVHLGLRPTYLVNAPALVKPLLKASEEVLDKSRLVSKLKPVLGESSLTMSGPAHQRRRAGLHSVLARSAVERLLPELSTEIRATAAHLATAGSFDAAAIGARLSMRLMSVAIFGRNVLSDADEQALAYAVHSVEDDFNADMFRVLPLTPWAARKRRRMRERSREAMQAIVARVKNRVSDTSAMRVLTGLQLSDEALSDEIITLLVAGHHTTGSCLAWTLYHLANEPDLAEAIQAEGARVSNGDGELDAASLKSAEVSLAFTKEILRLYPAAWWFARDVRKDASVEGVDLKAGSCLIFLPWQMHRDERYWVQPDEFHIDREFTNRAFIPFGAGHRACLGMGLAMLELQLATLEFGSAFQMRTRVTTPDLKLRGSVTLQPPHLPIFVEPAATQRPISHAA